MKKNDKKFSEDNSEKLSEETFVIKAGSKFNKLKCSILQWVGKDRSKEFDEGKEIKVTKQELEILKKTNWIQEDQ